MTLIVSESQGGGGPPAPAGMHQAVCAFVVDIGDEYSELFNRWTHKVVICFELAEVMEDGRPFMLSTRYTMSLSEKANLRRDLESWRGRSFTAEELKGFDLDKLVGVNATLNVIHKDRKGGGNQRAVIASVGPMMKGANKLAIRNEKPPEWLTKQAATNKEAADRRAAVEVGAEIDGPPPGLDDDNGGDTGLPF